MIEVRESRKRRAHPGEHGDKSGPQGNWQRPGRLFSRKAVSSMRKRYSCSDRNNQQCESADEQDVKEVHLVSGSYRDQPHSNDDKPVRRPYAPGERRPHGRKPPRRNAPSEPRRSPSPTSTNVTGGSSRHRRKRRAANVMRNACAMTNPV